MNKNKLQNIIFLFSCLVVIVGYFPLKFAKSINDYPINNNEYIICQEERVTGYKWKRITKFSGDNLQEAIRDNNIEVEYFNFVDDSPVNAPYNMHVSNIYVAYVEKLSEPIEDEFYENKVYICKDWEIVYPIQRETPFQILLPKHCFCVLDILEKQKGFFGVMFEILFFLFIVISFVAFFISIIKSI